MGITHPTELPRYTLELVQSEGVAVQLIYSCRKVGEADRHPLLERTVERLDGGGAVTLIGRERAVRFPLKEVEGTHKVSWFFKGSRNPQAELSWEIGSNGKIKSAQGSLRYPITYLADSGATTGYGLHLSAPFVSDQARHATASGGEINPEIIQRAEAVTARILAKYLVPKYGPSALELIRSSDGCTKQDGSID